MVNDATRIEIFSAEAVGKERFISDRRQIGGLMLLLGTCAAFQPLVSVGTLIGVGGTGASSAIELATLVGGLLQVIFGSMAMVVGYLSLVHDYGNKILSGTLILLTQFAWVPFITSMWDVGMAASGPFVVETLPVVGDGELILQQYVLNPFIPAIYVPTERDVRYFGAMGILGIVAYGTSFLGSLGFVEFALYSFDAGKPIARDAKYYQGRLLFYTFLLIIAGISQLLLAGYIILVFGTGPLVPHLGVAMYSVVYFPEISCTVGAVQMFVGYFGIARYLHWAPVGPSDHHFQVMILVQWVLMLVLQYIVQIGYGPNEENAEMLPSLVLLSVGLNVLPAFLDYKMRNTPWVLTNDYYGLMVKGQEQEQGVAKAHEVTDRDVEEGQAASVVGMNSASSVPEQQNHGGDGVIVASATLVDHDEPIQTIQHKAGSSNETNEIHVEPRKTQEFIPPQVPFPPERTMPPAEYMSPSKRFSDKPDPDERRPKLEDHSAHYSTRSISTKVRSNKTKDAERDTQWVDEYLQPLNDLLNQMEDYDGKSSSSGSSPSDSSGSSRHTDDDMSRDRSEEFSRDSEDMSRDTMSRDSFSDDGSPEPFIRGRGRDMHSDDRSRDRYSDDRSRDLYSEDASRASRDTDSVLSSDKLHSYQSDQDRSGAWSLLSPEPSSKDPVQSSAVKDTLDVESLLSPGPPQKVSLGGKAPVTPDPPSKVFGVDVSEQDLSVPLSAVTTESKRKLVAPDGSMDASGELLGYDSNQEPFLPGEVADDSTAILEQRLNEIEKEIFTDSMESFENVLANFL